MYFIRHNYTKDGYKIEYLTDDNSTLEERMEAYAEEVLKDRFKDIKRKYKGEEIDKRIKLEILNWKNNNRISFEKRSIKAQNTKEAVQNRLLDMYFDIYRDSKHAAHRTQPLGYGADQLKKLAKDIRKWNGTIRTDKEGNVIETDVESLKSTTPVFNLDVKARYKLGKALGSYALSNVHHALGQTVGLSLNQNIGSGNLNEFGNTSLAGLLGRDNEYIMEWFSALIDAHVDIAADPFIYFLNANDYTVKELSLLLRAGVGGIKTFKFIAQPILSSIAKEVENAKNNIGLDIRIADVVASIRKKYEAQARKHGVSYVEYNPSIDNFDSILNEAELEDAFKESAKENPKGSFYVQQLRVLDAFQSISLPAQMLSEAVMASRIDTKKFGTSFSEVENYTIRVQKALDDEAKGAGIQGFKKFIEDTYLGAYTNNSIDLSYGMLSNISLETKPAFRKAVRNILTSVNKRYTASEKLIKTVSDEIYTNLTAAYFKEKGILEESMIKSLIYGNNSIPKRVEDIKNGSIKGFEKYKDSGLLSKLVPYYKQDAPDMLIFNKPDDKYEKDSLVRSWKDMANSTNPDVRAFAQDLFYYSYLTSGFKNTLNSFYDLAPRELLIDEGYNEFIKEYFSKLNDPDYFDMFLDEFYLNSWNNSELVPEIKDKSIKSKKSASKGGTYMLFTDNISFYVGKNNKGQSIYRPYIKYKGPEGLELYKYTGTISERGKEFAIYYRVEKKGYNKNGFVVKENLTKGTIFSSNRTGLPDSVTKYLNPTNISSIANAKNKDGIKIFDFLSKADFVNIEDMVVSQYKNDIRDFDSETQAKINRIRPLDLTDEATKLFSTQEIVTTSLDIQKGFYTLNNNKIVFIDKIEEDSYLVEQWGYQTPTSEQIDANMKEC